MKGPGAVSCSSGLVLWWQQVEGGHSPCTGWVPLHQLAWSFPEEWKHLMFPELGLQAILGLIPTGMELGTCKDAVVTWPCNQKEMCHSPPSPFGWVRCISST